MTYDIRHILVATDMGGSGPAALRYASYISCRLLAPVSIVYADPLFYSMDMVPAQAVSLSATPDYEQRLQKEISDFAAEAMRDWPFKVIVEYGPAAPAILRAAERLDARLIVMGAHAHRGWRSALAGSVTSAVVHGSRCPVLTVSGLPEDEQPHFRRILCPVNFTDVARDALRFAALLADLFVSELVVVHVNEPGKPAMSEEKVREWVQPEMRDSFSFREIVLRGGPAERVLDCAEDIDADLLVIGAQHKAFRDATVIGTTTERVIRFADCPVMTFPRIAQKVKTVEAERELVTAG